MWTNDSRPHKAEIISAECRLSADIECVVFDSGLEIREDVSVSSRLVADRRFFVGSCPFPQ